MDHNPAPGQGPGLAGLKQVLGMFRTGFPDLQVTVEEVVAEGDKCMLRLRARGTHHGAFLGIPPTGKPVDFPAIDLYRMADGKIVEAWHLEDLLTMMMQVGAMQPPGG
jgi:predicted ester cyclase